jgi:hypothetical protein
VIVPIWTPLILEFGFAAISFEPNAEANPAANPILAASRLV